MLQWILACSTVTKLAPPVPSILRSASYARNALPLLRYLFPDTRYRARERLWAFRLDTLPKYRQRAQSRIWNFIVKRQLKSHQRKAAGNSILAPVKKRNREVSGALKIRDAAIGIKNMAQTGIAGALNSGGDGYRVTGERGSRRKKLAGYLRAANELRQSYQNAYAAAGQTDRAVDEDDAGIPGAFPELVVARSGVEEMVLFPSYARCHTKKEKPHPYAQNQPGASHDLQETTSTGDAEYWRKEWEVYEDANAVADVDIRGWIYTPHSGPMTRKNRLLFGIARHLSGIPAPNTGSQATSRATSRHRDGAAQHEEEIVEEEVEQISQRGRREADVAGRGGYSEKPGQYYDRADTHSHLDESRSPSPSPSSEYPSPGDFPHPLTDSSLGPDQSDVTSLGGLAKRLSWTQPSDMSPAELAIANKRLMARLKPFLTNPSVNQPLTIFFYNDETSQSRITHTNEAGHFNYRAALDFVPTHVRVLAGSNLSATEEVHITEPTGISLISDIDDTIKHSAIGRGAKEIFRNTFIRDLADLTIEGVKEWYTKMSEMDVKMHYVSNSPWQLYPVLVSYFAGAGLPRGSFHLKQYSGMLQGIFEPVAERKKGTLDRIMKDFPDRRFILVGDSGEADLELYTDIVMANPGRILGVFIRDVTTPPGQGFFDSSMGPLSAGGVRPPFHARGSGSGSGKGIVSPNSSSQIQEQRPALPVRPATGAPTKPNMHINSPIMDDLISFDDDPEAIKKPQRVSTSASTSDSRTAIHSSKSPLPLRPTKPLALRSVSSDSSITTQSTLSASNRKGPAPPPKPRKFSLSQDQTNKPPEHSPLAQIQNLSPPRSRASSLERQSYRTAVKNKVASAYNALPSPVAYFHGSSQTSSTSHSGESPRGFSTASTLRGAPPAPPRRNLTSYPAAAAQYASNRFGVNGVDESSPLSPLNKKEELWKRRWARAKDILDDKGVMLRAWRIGQDVVDEAVKLVEKAQREDREEDIPRWRRRC